MTSDFSIELPANRTGLGNVGAGIAIELFRRGLTPNIFPIGDADFGYTRVPEGFPEWFHYCTGKALSSYKKSEPSIRHWHIGESHVRLSDNATLYTVHETDVITREESNIMARYRRVLVPSQYSKQVFESQGLGAGVCPNFFDPGLFSIKKVPRAGLEGVTIFTVLGKMEKRKHTAQTIGAWIKRFGGKKEFRLHCHIFNYFLMQGVPQERQIEAHQRYLTRQLGFELPWNVTIYGFQTREEYNMSLNICDIDLGLSGGEGFGLPFFQTRVLGKRGVGLKAHAQIDYCSPKNTVFVEPSGKTDSHDGVFFQRGTPFNQGQIFVWEDDAAISAMEKALKMKPPAASVGKALAEKFSVKNTVDILLDF